MLYIGMDVSSKSFVIHAINERKKDVFKGEIAPTREGLKRLMRELGDEPKLVVFEAGNQMKWIALFLKKVVGVSIHVVHPNEVKWITSSNGKTDKVDARKMAELARGDLLPEKVHVVDGEVRKLRELINARTSLQSKRVALINTLRGYIRQEGIGFPAKFFQTREWSEKISKLKVGETQKIIFNSFMEAIAGILEAEEKLTEQILEVEDARIDLLKTIPAIGDLSSRVILSALDDANRFENKKKAANYAALTPTIYQSGGVLHQGHINRDGRREVRKVLIQCAHTISRMKSPGVKPLKDFFDGIAKKRSKKIAVIALARKLLTTAYGVLKTKKPYDPAKLLPYAAAA